MFTRRNFLKAMGGLPFGFYSLTASASQATTRNIPVIILWLAGGADPKSTFNPDAPSVSEDLRGPFKSIATKIPGVHINEHLPGLAARLHRGALLRGINTESADHNEATINMLKGGRSKPTVGKRFGEKAANGGLPYAFMFLQGTYTAIDLGHDHQDSFHIQWEKPVMSGETEVQCGRFLPPQMSPAPSLTERVALLKALDTTKLSTDQVVKMDRNRELALSLLTGGGRLLKAFQMTDKDKERYGCGQVGESVLLAKQLVKAGAGVVSIYQDYPQSWDTHTDLGKNIPIQAKPVDRAACALIDDILAGELDCVLFISSDFSRTPQVNTGGGRDHWSENNCAFFLGGKVKEGIVHGRSDQRGIVRDGEVKAKDSIANTIIKAAGGMILPTDQFAREIVRD